MKQIFKQFVISEIIIVFGLLFYGVYGLYNWRYKFNYEINEESLKSILFQLLFFFLVISVYNIFYTPIFVFIKYFFTKWVLIALILLFFVSLIALICNESLLQRYARYAHVGNESSAFNLNLFIGNNYFEVLAFCFLCLIHFIVTLIFFKKKN